MKISYDEDTMQYKTYAENSEVMSLTVQSNSWKVSSMRELIYIDIIGPLDGTTCE